MNISFNSIAENASRMFYKGVFKVKQHSPEILIAVGAVSIVAGVVCACKATLKSQNVLSEAKVAIDDIHEHTVEDDKVESTEDLTKNDAGKALIKVYASTSFDLVKLYAPAFILVAGGIGCMVGSHYIMRKRNAAAIAAYTAVCKSFEEYRNRVAERYGEDAEKQIRTGAIISDSENNETSSEQPKKSKSADPFSILFDETNEHWEKDSSYNLVFLRSVQNAANAKLKRKGHLFLNEVYDLLGVPNTPAGQFAGWIYDRTKPDIYSAVNLGLDSDDPQTKDFVEGYERSVWLTFNVKENILDKI